MFKFSAQVFFKLQVVFIKLIRNDTESMSIESNQANHNSSPCSSSRNGQFVDDSAFSNAPKVSNLIASAIHCRAGDNGGASTTAPVL
jgi:hypothetical protein